MADMVPDRLVGLTEMNCKADAEINRYNLNSSIKHDN